MTYIQSAFYITPHPECYKFYSLAGPLGDDLPKVSSVRTQSLEHHSDKYKTVICDLWLKNACNREQCGFSHNFNNLAPAPLPQHYKRKPCDNDFNKGACNYHFNCNYFHRYDYLHQEGNTVTVWTPDPLTPPYWVVYRVFNQGTDN